MFFEGCPKKLFSVRSWIRIYICLMINVDSTLNIYIWKMSTDLHMVNVRTLNQVVLHHFMQILQYDIDAKVGFGDKPP